jgi:hypothetical protein
MVCGHIHTASFRLPIDEEFPNLKIPIFFASSITPIFVNNPSYNLLELTYDESGTVIDINIQTQFFQLEEYSILK